MEQFHAVHLKCTGGTIVSDGWSDAQRRPLLNVLLDIPAGATFLKSVDFSGETKDAQFIANVIIAAIDKVGPELVVQTLTDNTANCKAAWQIIKQNYPQFCL